MNLSMSAQKYLDSMFNYSKEQLWAVYWLSTLSLFFIDFTWWTLVLYICFQGLGVVVTYHRYYSHGSFQFKHTWVKWLFTYFGLMAGQGSPIAWSAVHKAHHKNVDKHNDPHGPAHGLLRTFVFLEFSPYDLRTVVRLTKEKAHISLHKYYLFILLGSWLLGVLVGLPEVIPATALCILCTNLGNWIGHSNIGYKNFGNDSEDRNHWLGAIYFFGEGWHNNHHAKPNSYTTQVKWWEFDIAGFFIKHLLADKTTLK